MKNEKRIVPYFVYLVLMVLLHSTSAFAANRVPLVDTGLGECYDAVGNAISCPESGQPFYGQDAQYRRTSTAFLDNGDQTITDQNSGLMWFEAENGTQRIWEEAAVYCSELDFAGQTDWQLPSKSELESIVDYGQSYPAIRQPFSCQSSFYWSSTPHLPNPPYAWGVYCLDGADHWLHKSNEYNVRCVRAADKPQIAPKTDLQWQKNSSKALHTWQNALAYCENLSLDQQQDWRLPNIRELKSLLDYNRYYPAADPALSALNAVYWSSTTAATEEHSSAWAVFFGNGDDLWKEKVESYNVRCVRGGMTD